jgi:arylsulfatase
LIAFDKSIKKYPNIERFPGGASNDLKPDLKNPKNPLPLLDQNVRPGGGGG